ncbi:OmpA family protein [Mucilaginibacter sp.]|uniref:OmpA family protein n=1 Tax=Mucilaginibacter sp. TaxID=1882438 RepID=UPI003D0C3A15
MKSNLKKASLLLTGILVGGKLFAQTGDSTQVSKDYVKPFSSGDAFRTWSIGIGGGVINPFTVFGSNSKQDFTGPNTKIGYSGYIKKQILPSFGIQADFLGGTVAGHNSQPDAAGVSPYSSYDTKLNYGVALSGNFTLANINWRHNKGAIQPYITAGAGLLNYSPVLTTAAGNKENLNGGTNKTHTVYVPVGLGLKFDVAPGVNLDLGYQVNFTYADDVDGYSYGSTNDKFSYAHIGLEFALGKRSKPQLATHNPVSSMRTEYLWQNQNTKNQLQSQIDAEKAKNDQLRNDLNTTNANLAKFTVDSDGDGVPDFFDKCPNTPAGTQVDGSGCPLPVTKNVKVYVTEEDRKVVKEAIKNLEFDFGKATIRDHSKPSLDKVAQLLVDKNFSLKLAGHTDNVGSADANLKLSKDRAEAIKTYLVSQGANASRIEATGYGKTQPIATNKTAAGRQINRRVEFTLF